MAISSSEQPMDPSLSAFTAKTPTATDFIHGTFKGEPAITIPGEIEASLAKRFDKTLIGKFSQGKPGMEMIRKFLSIQNFSGKVFEGLLDKKHIIIRFEFTEDYIRLFSKPVWIVNGKPMRILKWIPDFRINREPSIVPIWISLPYLPIHLVNQSFIFSLVSSFSKPLRIDKATENLLRPSVARVQVEFDLLELLPSRVWVQSELGSGFWQSIEIDDPLPLYCKFCWHIGHEEHFCTVKYPEMKKSYTSTKTIHTHTEFRPKNKGDSEETLVPKNIESSAIDQGNELICNPLNKLDVSVESPAEFLDDTSGYFDQGKAVKDDIQQQSNASTVTTNLLEETMLQMEDKNHQNTLISFGSVSSAGFTPEKLQTTPIFSQHQMVNIVDGRKMESMGKKNDQNTVAPMELKGPADVALNDSPSYLISGEILAKGKMDEVITYSESCPTSNPFEVLSMPPTKEKPSGVDKSSLQDELRYMSLDPKAQLAEYISDKVFEEKFTPVKKITRVRKPKQILDL